MDKIEICKKIKKVVRHIVIDNGTKILSVGTGVVVKSDGTLITAKHVIESEIGIYHGKISAGGEEYQPAIYGFGININQPEFIDPISIDLTILKPVNKLAEVEYINLSVDIAEVGTDIVMAGFPDDIGLPLNFLKGIKPNILKNALDSRFKYSFRQLMFKSGMIGHCQNIHLNDFDVSQLGINGVQKINVLGATYWVDNQLTYGGSGGPIVNLNGELVGIICEKAFTKGVDNVPKLPSGTGMGLSHHLISWALPKI